MEILMVITLAVMGIYFFKSTDLPKDLKERSAKFESELRLDARQSSATRSLKMTIPSERIKTSSIENSLDAKLAAIMNEKKSREIQLLNKNIDDLTIEITTLEQEIRVNNEKNIEIQSMIDSRLISLQLLQEKITLLA